MPDSEISPPLLVLENISKTYRVGREQLHALSDINLRVWPGEVIAITGPSGSGKSTLANIAGGLLKPTAGTITKSGQKLRTRSDKLISHYRNQSVGFVLQNFGLLPEYSALENVIMPQMILGVGSRKRRQRAEHALALVDMQHFAHHKVHQLSGGQRQRVAIARALINNPQLIIADEPTGSLDSQNGDQVMQLLVTLAHQHLLAVLMVTHDPRLAAMADRQIQLIDGRVTEESQHA